jgi:1,2-diacylglycerol 3-alpha-glucosyltransferase
MNSTPNSAVTVIWIDWYSYHLARFRALVDHPALGAGQVSGVELVGKSGVHQGLTFRDEMRSELPLSTLEPDANWHDVPKLKLALALWRKLCELNPAAVLVPGYYTLPGIAAALWARCNGRLSVLMTESGEQDSARVSWKEWLKGKLIGALFHCAITGGKTHTRYLSKLGFHQQRIAGFYDVVDNRFFSQSTDLLRRNSEPYQYRLPRRYFLYVGRLAPEKNLTRLIRAFATYRAEGGDWELVLAGDGSLRNYLIAECVAKGVEASVHFTGMKRTEELIPCYAFASCFVLPSTREPWGLVANEAMASGLPLLLSTRCGCAADLLVEGVNGYLFDPFDERSLADRLLWMAGLSHQQREQMGQSSCDLIAEYSPDRFADEVARCIGLATSKVTAAA